MARYEILRPDPSYESCECDSVRSLIFVYDLSCSPISCSECRKIVDAEKLQLPPELVDAIFRWHRAFGSLYELWLDSGEYELWAKERMLDPTGQVNLDGLRIVSELSAHLPTRYWWFHDTDDPLPPNCPNCASSLLPSTGYGVLQCSDCPVLL